MKYFILSLLCFSQLITAKEFIHLASLPKLTPSGNEIVFEWQGDIWKVSSKGGKAQQLTEHPARDGRSCISPDGKTIAFSSWRDGRWQIYTMPINGGTPTKLTNGPGTTAVDWYPDGKHLLTWVDRDELGFLSARFYKISIDNPNVEKRIFNDHAGSAQISPDGKKILFVRGGTHLYRKNYSGSAASQLWLYDCESKTFTQYCKDKQGSRSPLWKADGTGFYYLSQKNNKCFNLWEYDFKTKKKKQLTFFTDSSIITPAISKDGSTITFRQLFDFYTYHPKQNKKPQKITIWHEQDKKIPEKQRRWYNKCWNNEDYGSIDFTHDGLEMTFTTGGDLWVMDTVLRQPIQITNTTIGHETEAIFSKDHNTIYYLSDIGTKVELWKATRKDGNKYWWQNKQFNLTKLSKDDDNSAKSLLSLSPDGKKLMYYCELGTLKLYDIKSKTEKVIIQTSSPIYYDWSPDSKWITCTHKDNDGNNDIWIYSLDGKTKPYNLSQYADWDGNPTWSPNGKIIAYLGRRFDSELSIFYVYLDEKYEDISPEQKKLYQALTTMTKIRGGEKIENPVPKANKKDVKINFTNLNKRIHRIHLPNNSINGLFWSPDSKQLAFSANINNKPGTYKISFPNNLKPTLLCSQHGWQAQWVEKNKIYWLINGIPANMTHKYNFEAYQTTDLHQYYRLIFRLAWRKMRDNFYDSKLNNKNWNAIRLKYEDMAAETCNKEALAKIIALMLGELNASHLGFTLKENSSNWKNNEWQIQTAHLGVRFDQNYQGAGLKVQSIVKGGPVDNNKNRILPGEIIVQINDKTVFPDTDLTTILNGRPNQYVTLKVCNKDGERRDIKIKTISYKKANILGKLELIENNRKLVDKLSNNKLGYLYIKEMNWNSLRKFEKEIFACGLGKEGMIIDVRNNPGGFTADHLLATLCHPDHAITIPRNGGRGYPMGYLPKVTWHKPITVLCNQYSASNAEIFSHAIKTINRGKLVGVPTPGSVISTSNATILDMGTLRIPARGWYCKNNGIDMELEGAIPDYIVWPKPNEIPNGIDKQLEKAIKVLLQEVKTKNEIPEKKLTTASSKRK